MERIQEAEEGMEEDDGMEEDTGEGETEHDAGEVGHGLDGNS